MNKPMIKVKRKHILISNDDGVYAPGLAVLAEVLKKIADVTVVAPDRNRSGASHSLTLTRPLRIQTLENGFISVDGTPTDCVHIAISGLIQTLPDVVVSGVNNGANLGDDVLYSGTVAAAMEGRFLGFPAIAISCVGQNCKNYTTAAIIARNIVLRLFEDPLPASTILNVNVPDLHFKKLKGYEVTRLGTRHYADPVIKTKDPRDETIYWLGPSGVEKDAGPGTDFHAIKDNKISITPLNPDLTHYPLCQELKPYLNGLIL